MIALSRTYPCVLLPLPLTMFYYFLLEFLRICFVRIDFSIFSFRFDSVVQLVSRYLFSAMTFRVVPLSTSTCVCVPVSVCYPGLPAPDLARSIFVTRPKICDGSVFLFLPV